MKNNQLLRYLFQHQTDPQPISIDRKTLKFMVGSSYATNLTLLRQNVLEGLISSYRQHLKITVIFVGGTFDRIEFTFGPSEVLLEYRYLNQRAFTPLEQTAYLCKLNSCPLSKDETQAYYRACRKLKGRKRIIKTVKLIYFDRQGALVSDYLHDKVG